MAESLPDRPDDSGRRQTDEARRPRWVTAVVAGAVVLLAVVVLLHLTGNSLGGPGSHLP